MYYPQPPQMNYMPQQQPQGMFGNFIMNQLSQHMYGSGSNKTIQPWWIILIQLNILPILNIFCK